MGRRAGRKRRRRRRRPIESIQCSVLVDAPAVTEVGPIGDRGTIADLAARVELGEPDLGSGQEGGHRCASADRHLVTERVARPKVGGGAGGRELGGCEVKNNSRGSGTAIDADGQGDRVGDITSIDDGAPDQIGTPHADGDIDKAGRIPEESRIAHSCFGDGSII